MVSPRNPPQFDILAMIAKYRPNVAKSQARRIAHFLDWAATNYGGQNFAHNIILRAVNNYSHTPRPNTDEVKGVRSAMSRVKLILRRDYNRGFSSIPGQVRACTDDNDVVNYNLAAVNKRLVSAYGHVENVRSIVNPKKLTGSAASYYRTTSKTLSMAGSDIAALLKP